MSFQTARFFGPTGDDVLDVMLGGVAWDVADSETLTWAIADGFDGFAWSDILAAEEQFERAIDAFARFVDVEFSFLGVFDNPTDAGAAGADIVYSVDNTFSRDGTLAYAYFPGRGAQIFDRNPNEGGDVFLNFSTRLIAESTFDAGSDGFLTIIHELGHALGLKHPFEAEGFFPSVEQTGRDDILDVDWFSIMSYTDLYEAELTRWDPATPMLLDVLALQYLYGSNQDTFAGDDRHELASVPYYYSIWDAGGEDEIDASGLAHGWRIVLPNSVETPSVDAPTGFAIPQDEYNARLVQSEPTELVWLVGDIENATGTDHSDELIGTPLSNNLYGGRGADTLQGLSGDDLLDGGDGTDLALYSGARYNYTIAFSREGTEISDRLAGRDGTDAFIDIELLRFEGDAGDRVFDLTGFGAPTDLAFADLEAIVELYIAYFNRAPDAEGLWFWANAFSDGATLETLALLFADQTETRALYPEDRSNSDFATTVYENVLGRQPDDAGLIFWVDTLDKGAVTRDQFILEVLRGAKAEPLARMSKDFVDQQTADRSYLETKVDLGALFAVHFGMSNVENASTAMALFDGSDASATQAVEAIEAFHANALDPSEGELLLPLVGVWSQTFEGIV